MAPPATLLLTRPRAASERFAAQVKEMLRPVEILISPLLEINFTHIPDVPTAGTVVFTSRNGVEAWERAKYSANQRCFCVGHATGEAARALGFDPHVSGGTVKQMVQDIIAAAPEGEILHIHGRHTRGDLVGQLAAKNLNARGIVVYEQRLLQLSDDAKTLLQGGARVIVPLFSPRSAAQFAKEGPFGVQIDIIAISQTAADTCQGARVAPHPNADGMLAAIAQGLIA
jgi:uroporphyrinogen-III synthase